MRKLSIAVAAGLSALLASPALAQESSYVPGTVWQVSSIKVMPGQFENYMDYLGGNWRKELEFERQAGYVVSYHIFAVNNARADEPDLFLAIEYKDYITIAQQLDLQKKITAMMASDNRKMETAAGQRVTMRKEMGSMELQELKLK
jgi:hypothetical protein